MHYTRVHSLAVLHHVPHARTASTSTNHFGTPFPYPSHPHPTPHQIFHLPAGASQKDIKQRYYDLVREHHPDSPRCRHLSAEQRHARFQSITAAYDTLRGVKLSARRHDHAFEAELARRRRAQHRGRPFAHDFAYEHGYRTAGHTATADDAWKDRTIIAAGLVSILVALGPLIWTNPVAVSQERHLSAAANLAQARKEAQEYGTLRREEIHRHVEEHRRLQDQAARGKAGTDESALE